MASSGKGEDIPIPKQARVTTHNQLRGILVDLRNRFCRHN